MVEKVDVTIRIEKSEQNRMDEIVDALKVSGLDDVESHKRFMIVNGSVNADGLDDLRKVKGVASVHQDSTYKTQKR
ncbi:hypothetical protein FXV83_09200 [Bradyrhizobium hipponense]|uniref:HMA domain-containing protein n=1 Tax=Bradyrhizobium hipponense TaxID=2605638 RepID=A0A5S4YSD7_9BRAD|nr:hypothetical protein [Bradyrhizobium hipponense]TYO66963.1 hypothetical protein FXV83_09200 [Bradyrhizobium hipponense]